MCCLIIAWHHARWASSHRSQELLLEAIGRAAFEATELPLVLSAAQVQRLDKRGNTTAVRSDADCRRLRNAPGIIVCNTLLRTARSSRDVQSDAHATFATAAATLLMPSSGDGPDVANGSDADTRRVDL